MGTTPELRPLRALARGYSQCCPPGNKRHIVLHPSYFYDTQTFSSFAELKEKAKAFTAFHNENHRYSSQGNSTPNQIVRQISHKNQLTKDIDFTKKIFVDKGRLFFIRFIRSDLKLCLLNEIFTVKPTLKYTYVVAEIVLEKFVLVVSQNNTVHHIFPFAMSLP